MLKDNQEILIRHLIRFHILDYESCLQVLDTENTGDKVAMSYVFRPLTKQKYIIKDKDGIVSILKKGKELFSNEAPLISIGGGKQNQKRILQVSRVAALLEKNGVEISGKLRSRNVPYFIPSACWREIAPGILSTTRFAGMLLAYGKKYAVYDIGDGTMEWQVRAETSLFYRKYGSYETRADGMILICDDGKRDEIAERIIRQTMWSRKTLLKERYTETNKPIRYSRSPIKLRTQYRRVYLTTPSRLRTSLQRIYDEEQTIASTIPDAEICYDRSCGDVQIWPMWYYINPAYDLLKFVYFFSEAKSHLQRKDDNSNSSPKIEFTIVLHQEDKRILKMYPDVLQPERVSLLVYQSTKNTESN